MEKKELRSVLLAKRSSLPERDSLNMRIVAQLQSESLLWDKCTNILAYLPFRGEVDLTPFFEVLELQEKHLCLPKVIDKQQGIMEAVQVLAPWEQNVAPGAYGIMEPTGGAFVDPCEIDLALIPGVAYDHECYRLGYGGGYYDRFLPRLSPRTIKIGIAFNMQLVDKVPRDPHDIPLDGLCTEYGLKMCR